MAYPETTGLEKPEIERPGFKASNWYLAIFFSSVFFLFSFALLLMPPLFPLFFVLFSLPIIVWNNAVKASKKHHRYAQTPKGFILKLNLAMFAGAILVPLLAIVGNLMIKIASFLS